MNNYSATGRIVADPRFNTVGTKDTSVLNFSVAIATGQPKKDGDAYPPSFILEVSLWGKYADAMNPLLKKGMLVGVSGQLHGCKAWSSGEDQTAKGNVVLGGNVQIDLLSKVESSEEEEPKASKKGSSKKDIAVDKTDVNLFD